MNPETPVRIAVGILLGMLTIIGTYFRLRAASTGEAIDRWQEGAVILFGIRLTGFLAIAGLFAYLISPTWMAWSSFVRIGEWHLPNWIRWIGVGVGAVAVLLVFWTFATLGKNLTDTVVTRKEHTLITNGPYRWVRHPFYGSFVLFVLGLSIAITNWFIPLVCAITLALLIKRTDTEEAKLVKRFGDDYRLYMQKTGRFFPNLAR